MPKGIVLIGWTNKEGFFLIHKHPSSVTLTDEEVMRIGSTHRMRNLDANIVSLRLKDLNVCSFFSGLITSKYHIAPNFVIALLLDHSEDPKEYLRVLPKGSEIVLSEFPVKRFDARTTTFRDVLSNIGQSFLTTLPKLYDALLNRKIAVQADVDTFFETLARDLEPSTTTIDISTETNVSVLRKKIEEQDGVIKMLQNIVEGKDFSSGATEYLAKIETFKSQISNLEQHLKEKDDQISTLDMQLSRVELLETRIQTLQSDILSRDAEIANLRTRLTVSSGLPSGLGTGASSEEVQVWQKKVVELQNELLERNSIIKQLKTQLAGQLDNKEARALMADLSEQLATHSTTGDELEDEMKSKYISL